MGALLLIISEWLVRHRALICCPFYLSNFGDSYCRLFRH
jgi:hypothetical protein